MYHQKYQIADKLWFFFMASILPNTIPASEFKSNLAKQALPPTKAKSTLNSNREGTPENTNMHFDAGLRLSFWGFVFIIIKRRRWREVKEGRDGGRWGRGMKWRYKPLQKSLLTPEPMKYFLTLLQRVNISIKIAYLILSYKQLHGNVIIIHWNHLLSWLSTQGLYKTEISSLLCLFIYFHRKRYNSKISM